TMLFVRERAAKKLDDLRRGERLEDVNLGAGKKRGDDFERGIFGGGADERDVAGFDVRKKRVLLGFVEAVDFVDKDHGAVAGARFVFGSGHDVFDFLDAGENGAEGDEFGARETGNKASEGAAIDFFRAARALVADEQRSRLAPIDFPGGQQGLAAVLRFAHAGSQRADAGDFELRQENGKRHSGKDWEMEGGPGGGA